MMIDLGEAQPIDDAVKELRQHIKRFSESAAGSGIQLIDVAAKEDEYKKIALKLYLLLFEHADRPQAQTQTITCETNTVGV